MGATNADTGQDLRAQQELEEERQQDKLKRQQVQKDKLLAFQRAKSGMSLADQSGAGDLLGGR